MYQVLSKLDIQLMAESIERSAHNSEVYSKKIARWYEEVEQLVMELCKEALLNEYGERVNELRSKKSQLEREMREAGGVDFNADSHPADCLLQKKVPYQFYLCFANLLQLNNQK